MYFPDEVFRHIASYNFDPYKEDRKKHASVWQKIRVKRERMVDVFRYTTPDGDIVDDVDTTHEDEYYVYSMYNEHIASIPTRFVDLDNIHEHTEFYLDDEFDYDTEEEDTWYNYAWIQYGMCPRNDYKPGSNNRVYSNRWLNNIYKRK